MPVTPRSYTDIYNSLKATIQNPANPDLDFSEGSYLNIIVGAYSLGFQEIQNLIIDLFAKTQLQNAQTRGEDLEALAVDHFHEGIARPGLTNAVGAVTVTRESGNSDAINITTANTFVSDGKEFLPISPVTILAANASGVVLLRAVEGGKASNVKAGADWTTTVSGVTVANTADFQGGNEPLSDGDYRVFIKNFIENLQDGTRQGLEGSAKIVPGVQDAKLIKKLVSVGTLTNAGALEASPTRFNTIINTLYVAGTNGQANEAILELVKRNVNRQLSAGEVIVFSSTTPRSIDWSVTLTFTATADALALSKRRDDLKQAFEQAINDLAIGTDFIRTDMATKVLTDNNWAGLFTVETSTPSGDVTIGNTEKAIAGTVTVEVT